MDALFKAVRRSRSPNLTKDSSGRTGHQKLSEGWDEHKEPVAGTGVIFYLKYLGSGLVEALPDGESYGDGTGSRAVVNVVSMAKSAGKKLKKVSLNVTNNGIVIADLLTKETLFNVSIYRISFCTADKNHDKVFAFIARNTTNETMECHAFLCAKAKIAQAVTLTVSQAFSLASELDAKETNERGRTRLHDKDVMSDDSSQEYIDDSSDTMKKTIIQNQISEDYSSPAIVLCPPNGHPNPSRPSPREQGHLVQVNQPDDDFELEDDFSRLAEHRSRQTVPGFSTDLRQEDIDENVQEYFNEQRCFEAFSRQKSLEDLLSL